MFYGKRIKMLEERLAKAEQFERGVCTVIDNYFATNEKKALSFSTDCVCDKFYHFVTSVDEKLKRLSKIEDENAELREENASQEDTISHLQETVKTKNAIIHNQEKEITELAEDRSMMQIQLIAKTRENAKSRIGTTKGGKK